MLIYLFIGTAVSDDVWWWVQWITDQCVPMVRWWWCRFVMPVVVINLNGDLVVTVCVCGAVNAMVNRRWWTGGAMIGAVTIVLCDDKCATGGRWWWWWWRMVPVCRWTGPVVPVMGDDCAVMVNNGECNEWSMVMVTMVVADGGEWWWWWVVSITMVNILIK